MHAVVETSLTFRGETFTIIEGDFPWTRVRPDNAHRHNREEVLYLEDDHDGSFAITPMQAFILSQLEQSDVPLTRADLRARVPEGKSPVSVNAQIDRLITGMTEAFGQSLIDVTYPPRTTPGRGGLSAHYAVRRGPSGR